MKLRNKKTGDIVEYESFGFRKRLRNGWNDFIPSAHSLAELNEVWEDYEPKEPLIKDEKICKAIRAWADVNKIERLAIQSNIDSYSSQYCWGIVEEMRDDFELLEKLEELCGEEEE